MFRYCLGDVIAVYTQNYQDVPFGEGHIAASNRAWDETAFQFGANEPMDWLADLLKKAGLEPKWHPEFVQGGRYH